ncbi:respirasome Complex Assembly Factor 1-like [Scyliorhinus canicula]|uniref:respirasome Complex Assembly Factor 1-like n=1 Tax=Scyliorhinus canicula TaxID=7830 RepID=UPI0018F4358D|nr:respirasome Complex Assembly Factor 1-like [Scyliorhinus canicula]
MIKYIDKVDVERLLPLLRQSGVIVHKRWIAAVTARRCIGVEDKGEFLDVIYWFRQIIAISLGVIWGVVPLKGFLGIAIFCLINAGLLYLYFSSFQQVDEEEYGGTWELTKEGFMTSFALILVVWIIFNTAIHFD